MHAKTVTDESYRLYSLLINHTMKLKNMSYLLNVFVRELMCVPLTMCVLTSFQALTYDDKNAIKTITMRPIYRMAQKCHSF